MIQGAWVSEGFRFEKAPLFAESETKFFLTKTNGDFEFMEDDEGEVKYLLIYRGGAPELSIRQ